VIYIRFKEAIEDSTFDRGHFKYVERIGRLRFGPLAVNGNIGTHHFAKVVWNDSGSSGTERWTELHANLLPGRIHVYQLGSIVAQELEYAADTNRLLALGSLPEAVTESDAKAVKKLLKDYSLTYLNEAAESLIDVKTREERTFLSVRCWSLSKE